MRFVVRYMWQTSSSKSASAFGGAPAAGGAKKLAGAIGGLLGKMRRRKGADGADEPANDAEGSEQRDDVFESKHVKEIIETYENVMTLMDEEEAELNHFINEDPYGEEDNVKQSKGQEKPPKVFKARLNAPAQPKREVVAEKTEEKKVDNQRPKDEVIDASEFSEAERELYEKIRRQEMLDMQGQVDSDYYDEDEGFAEVDKYGVTKVRSIKDPNQKQKPQQ